MEKAQNLSSKMSYINLINGDLNDPLCNLARAIMATRVNEQLKVGKKKPRVIWSKELNQAIPLWELSTTNYAIASLTFTNTSEKKIKVTSNVFGAGSTDKDGKKSSAISPEDHSERSALADVINQAIFEGWPQGQDIGKLKKPYSMENLQKYSKALGTTNIILFSEKEPCNRKVLTFTIQKGVNTCSELLQSILTPKKYELYHTINWDANQKQEFTNDVKLAREEYYKILDYSIHQKWIEEHKDAPEVQKAIKYGENLKRLDSVAEAPKTAEKKVAKKQRTESKTSDINYYHENSTNSTRKAETRNRVSFYRGIRF